MKWKIKNAEQYEENNNNSVLDTVTDIVIVKSFFTLDLSRSLNTLTFCTQKQAEVIQWNQMLLLR